MHHGVHAGRATSTRRSRISKFGTLFVSIGLLAGVSAAAAPSVGAAATWSVTPTPALAGSTSSSLRAISCPATNSCFAVGRVTTVSAVKTLIEHWNGHNFGTQPSPNPTPDREPQRYRLPEQEELLRGRQLHLRILGVHVDRALERQHVVEAGQPESE